MTGLYTPVGGRQGTADGTGDAALGGMTAGTVGAADGETAVLMALLVERTRLPLPVTTTATGTPRVTGAATVPTLTVRAAGTPRVTGAAALPLPPVTVTATGTPRITGAVALPLLSLTASGAPRVTGTARLRTLSLTAAGTLTVVGSAALRLLRLVVRGGPRNRRVRVVREHVGPTVTVTHDATGPRVRSTAAGDP
jgi:hypothetical protein